MTRQCQALLLFLVLFSVRCSQFNRASDGPAGIDTQGDPFLSYIGAQDALASDDEDRARAFLVELSESSDPPLGDLAAQAARSPSIDVMRNAFAEVSDSLIGSASIPQGYIVVFCPMARGGAGANWVQQKGEIRNPYLGSAMLGCGVPVETP